MEREFRTKRREKRRIGYCAEMDCGFSFDIVTTIFGFATDSDDEPEFLTDLLEAPVEVVSPSFLHTLTLKRRGVSNLTGMSKTITSF